MFKSIKRVLFGEPKDDMESIVRSWDKYFNNVLGGGSTVYILRDDSDGSIILRKSGSAYLFFNKDEAKRHSLKIMSKYNVGNIIIEKRRLA